MYSWKQRQGGRTGSFSTRATPPSHTIETAPAPGSHSLPQTDTAVDPFLLDFGTSVNVHDELRHSIRAEITELEARLGQCKKSCKQEEKQHQLLEDDLKHAKKELDGLYQQTTAGLETAAVHKTFAHRFQQSIQLELISRETPKLTNVETGEEEFSGPDPGCVVGFEAEREQNAERQLAHFKGSLQSLSREIDQADSEEAARRSDLQDILDRSQKERLKDTKQNLMQQLRVHVDDIKREAGRERAIQNAIRQNQIESNKQGHSLAGLTARLKQLRGQHADEEAILQRALKEKRAAKEAVNQKVQIDRAELTGLKSRVDQVNAYHIQAHTLVEECKAEGKQFQESEKRIKLIQAELDGATSRLQAAKYDEEQSKNNFQKSEENATAILAAKAANDELEKDMGSFSKHMDILTQEETSIATTIDAIRTATQMRLDVIELKKKEILDKSKLAETSLAVAETKHAEISADRAYLVKQRNDCKKRWVDQSEHLGKSIQMCEDSCKMEASKNGKSRQSLAHKKAQIFGDIEDATSKSLACMGLKIRILNQAKLLLEETREKEQEIAAASSSKVADVRSRVIVK